MPYALAYRSNTAAEFWVVFSRLQAGGFHPFAPNFHHGTIAAGYILALGGFDILLPEEEMNDANEWMTDIRPIEDFDPIKDRPIRDIVYACILTMNPSFALLMLPPVLLLIGWAGLILLGSFLFEQPIWQVGLAGLNMLCIIGILIHSRHKVKNKKRLQP